MWFMLFFGIVFVGCYDDDVMFVFGEGDEFVIDIGLYVVVVGCIEGVDIDDFYDMFFVLGSRLV